VRRRDGVDDVGIDGCVGVDDLAGVGSVARVRRLVRVGYAAGVGGAGRQLGIRDAQDEVASRHQGDRCDQRRSPLAPHDGQSYWLRHVGGTV
jgi:hypothetical protein